MGDKKKVDVEFCIILIDKLSSPTISKSDSEMVLKELLEAACHDELREMLREGADNIASLRDDFKQKAMSLNGDAPPEEGDAASDDKIDYVALLRKLIDKNISDSEVKPAMNLLLNGKLTVDQKHQAQIIINCKDAEQKENMIEDFKKSFLPKPKPKIKQAVTSNKTVTTVNAAPEEKDEHLLGDFRTLISRLVDPQMDPNKKREIYMRLMEPDVDVDYKNVAIKLIAPQNKDRGEVLIAELDRDLRNRKEREELMARKKKEEDLRRKEEVERQRNLELEKKRRLSTMTYNRKKILMMQKRELTLKMRAELRRKDTKIEQMTEGEKEEARRQEREKVKQEMRRIRAEQKSKAFCDDVVKNKDNRLSYIRLPWSRDSQLSTMRLEVTDISRSEHLSQSEKLKLDKLLQKFPKKKTCESTADDKNDSKLSETSDIPKIDKVSDEASDKIDLDANKAATESGNHKEGSIDKAAEKSTASSTNADSTVSSEFDNYFKMLNNTELSETKEIEIIKELIVARKTPLLKDLVIKLSSIKGTGKSKMFETLCAKFVGTRNYIEQEEGSANLNKHSTSESVDEKVQNDDNKESNSKTDDANQSNEKPEEIKEPENGHISTSSVEKAAEENIETKSEEDKDTNGKRDVTDANESQSTNEVKSMIKSQHINNVSAKENDEYARNNGSLPSAPVAEENENSKKELPIDKCSGDEISESLQSQNGNDQSDEKNGNLVESMEGNNRLYQDGAGQELQESSTEASDNKVDVMNMSMKQIRETFNLKRIHSYVKIKNNKTLYVAFLAQKKLEAYKEQRSKETKINPLFKPSTLNGLDRKSDCDNIPETSNVPTKSEEIRKDSENESSSKTKVCNGITVSTPLTNGVTTFTKKRPSTELNVDVSPQKRLKDDVNESQIKEMSAFLSRSRSRSRSRSLSRSNSRSRSRSRSRSLPRSKSRSRSRSRSRSLPRSKSRSRSRSRSRSLSRSKSRSHSRSPSKSRSRTRSRSRSRSRSFPRTSSRSRSKSRSLSRSSSRSRSRSKSKSRSRSQSRS